MRHAMPESLPVLSLILSAMLNLVGIVVVIISPLHK